MQINPLMSIVEERTNKAIIHHSAEQQSAHGNKKHCDQLGVSKFEE